MADVMQAYAHWHGARCELASTQLMQWLGIKRLHNKVPVAECVWSSASGLRLVVSDVALRADCRNLRPNRRLGGLPARTDLVAVQGGVDTFEFSVDDVAVLRLVLGGAREPELHTAFAAGTIAVLACASAIIGLSSEKSITKVD